MSTREGIRFDLLCAAQRIPRPLPEYQFALALGRKWAFDWVWPDARLALEVDGGGWQRGRHHRHDGFIEDCHKLNTAIALGWVVLRVTPEMVADGSAFDYVRRALDARRPA